MTEDDARDWLSDVPRETFALLELFTDMVTAENERHNLIARASVGQMWVRHIVDSVQLVGLAPPEGRWLDIGSGAGFPGLVVAIVGNHHVTLAEPRRLRVDFLQSAIERLGLCARATVWPGRVETLRADPFDVISARAFAPLERLLPAAEHLATPRTRWILPKGRSAQAELEVARRSWQGDLTVVPSLTDDEAAIVVAQGLTRRAGAVERGNSR